jgi:hypothetical protein
MGEAQQHLVMPVKTGIQEGMNSCSLDPGLRRDDQNTWGTPDEYCSKQLPALFFMQRCDKKEGYSPSGDLAGSNS